MIDTLAEIVAFILALCLIPMSLSMAAVSVCMVRDVFFRKD